MKRMSVLTMVLVLGFSALAFSNENEEQVDWAAFNNNIVTALQSKNEGLQVSAMIQYLTHADKFNINSAVYNVVGLYRDSENINVKRMALATLHKMDNKWANGFLRRAVKFEESPVLKTQIYHMIAARHQKVEQVDTGVMVAAN